jgi:hypothetical protein
MPGPVDPDRLLAAELVEGALETARGMILPAWQRRDVGAVGSRP